MGNYIIFLITLLFIYAASGAQMHTGVVKGVLIDSVSNKPLEGASIAIVKANDSVVVSSALSSEEGVFVITNLDSGNYDLLVSFQGFDPLQKEFIISPEFSVTDVGTINLIRAVRTLQEVIIKDRIPVRIKGDTISFNANSYKTRINASAEDLLKKLPGVEVQSNGTIKAQGEEVQKIYVDGREFFGNDPSQAAQNLTADMIDRVELYNERSEQSQFSGIDDGNRAKVINLKLKKSKKNGLTVKGYIGAGSDDRYESGLNTNYFKGATRIAVIARSNNINTSGPLGTASSAGAGKGNIAGLNPGLNKNTQIGTSYNDIWGKNLELAMSYSFRNFDNINDAFNRRQFFFPDSTVIRNQMSMSRSSSNSHSMQLRLHFMIDSMNSLLYTPVIRNQNNQLRRSDSTETIATKGNRKVSDSRSFINNLGNGVIARHNLLYRRRFRKDRRTFSINLIYLFNRNNRTENPFSRIGQYRAGDKLSDRIIQQSAMQQTQQGNSEITLSYTEPLGKNQTLELNYQHSNGRIESDRTTLDWNNQTDSYDLNNVEQTNFFKSTVATDRLGTNIRIGKQQYSLQFGLALQQTLLRTNNLSKGTANRQKFINILPNAYFNKQLGRSKNLQLTYNGYSAQPSALQLQEVVNKSSPLYWTAGNTGLKQEFSNNYSISYNTFNLDNYSSFFLTASFSNTYNKIVNHVLSRPQLIYGTGLLSLNDSIPQGVQLLMPVNANGAYNFAANMNLSAPIRKWEGSNISFTTTFIYNRDISLADNRKNFTHNLILGQDLKLDVQHGEKLNACLRGGVQYSAIKNTLQPQKVPPFVLYTAVADFHFDFSESFTLSTTLDYRANKGLGETYNQNFLLWNAGLSKFVFKNKRGEIRLFLNDLLNKNQNVSRIVTNNSIEDSRNTVLRRYALLSFVYHLSTSFNKNDK